MPEQVDQAHLDRDHPAAVGRRAEGGREVELGERGIGRQRGIVPVAAATSVTPCASAAAATAA